MQRNLGVLGFGFILAGYGVLFSCSGASPAPNGNPFGLGSSGSASGAGAGELDAGASTSGLQESAGSNVSSGSNGGSGSNGASGTSPIAAPGSEDASVEDASVGGPSGSGASSLPSGGSNPSSQFLPKVSGTCPSLKTGTVTVSGQSVTIWAGTPTADQHGPLVLYWHGTGGQPSEAQLTFGQAQIDAVTKLGGLVASFSTSTKMGTDVTAVLGVWYTGDFDMADQIVACAIDQLHIDPRRIYTSGGSAGGLMTVWLSYARSGYIAAAAPLSGGLTGISGISLDPVNMPQDPSSVPAAMATHGAEGSDVVVIDFAQASAAWEADVAKKGGFSLDCNTGGGHVSGPPQISPAIWQFFEDHPFKVKPEPYKSGIPSIFPSYCKIGPRLADGGAP